MNTAHLNSILAANTVFASFADLLATDQSYVPTLNVGVTPEFMDVATALVAAGRDAYVTGAGHAFFASTKLAVPSLRGADGCVLKVGSRVNFPSASMPGGRRNGKVVAIHKSRVTVSYTFKNGYAATKAVPASQCFKGC